MSIEPKTACSDSSEYGSVKLSKVRLSIYFTSGYVLFSDFNVKLCGNSVVKLHLCHICAEIFDVSHRHLALVNGNAELFADCICSFFNRNRAKKLAVFTGLSLKFYSLAIELCLCFICIIYFDLYLMLLGGFAVAKLRESLSICLNCKSLRKKKVTGITIGRLDFFAGFAESLYIFLRMTSIFINPFFYTAPVFRNRNHKLL